MSKKNRRRSGNAGLLPLFCALLANCPISLAAQPMDFNFGVIGQIIASPADDAALAQAIVATDADNLAFIVVEGLKRADEPCSDQLYQHRLELLGGAKNGLVLTLAGSDWAECASAGDHSNSVERLGRLRELCFIDDFSLGASKIPVMRESSIPKFRSFVENSRWEIGSVLFATANLPANNNHYRMEAGRNSEFEDRLIANRDWLQRAFAVATRKKMTAIALFCDGNPLQKPHAQHGQDGGAKRDGYAEVRQQLSVLASKFPGKVLLIHNRHDDARDTNAGIVWHGNVGDLGVGAEWVKLSVKSGNPELVGMVKRSNDTGSGRAESSKRR